jgi:hypothetical protein
MKKTGCSSDGYEFFIFLTVRLIIINFNHYKIVPIINNERKND